MKRFQHASVALSLFIVAVLFFFKSQFLLISKERDGSEETLIKNQQTSESGHVSSLPLVTLEKLEHHPEPSTLNAGVKTPPFEFRGGSGTGRIIDREGKVLLESSEEHGIFGAAVSPDGLKVLVDAANKTGGSCLVIEPSGRSQIILPSRPPGADMFLLSWSWVGPNLLFGSSGVERISHDGSHHQNCLEDNVSETKFYTFSILTKILSELTFPEGVRFPLINAKEVRGSGEIHFVKEAAEQDAVEDLGWFKIKSMN